jgi:hypothetical protein
LINSKGEKAVSSASSCINEVSPMERIESKEHEGLVTFRIKKRASTRK